ncbi:hypothetical protein Hypma_012423 [Hypsizygus marmoreus]|uniref:BOD1/SHG1 domain-containing protein n=1 Tax=Hypsizygus marmoreus TaxID=39966 RepID=A0A369JED2_HYPMA|nr:hypothetical protein Hypma_012423 [Hypsizygus marmoreus]
MPIDNPTQLVDEFKKSGEFDRLRRELLSQFQQSDGNSALKARVGDIARNRLESDQKLRFLPHEAVHRELMQELDRYPIVERAVADVHMLSDPTFAASIRKSVHNVLLESKGQKPQPQKDSKVEVIPSVKPAAIHRSKAVNDAQQSAVPEPSVASTPGLQSPKVSSATPPPITTFERSQVRASTEVLESEKMSIATVAPAADVSETPTLAAVVAQPIVDVDMVDGTQPDAGDAVTS